LNLALGRRIAQIAQLCRGVTNKRALFCARLAEKKKFLPADFFHKRRVVGKKFRQA